MLPITMKALRLATTLLLLLAAPSFAQTGQQQGGNNANSKQNNKQEAPNAKESEGPRRFWQASFPDGGHYMVALDRIATISMHQYLLDANLVVNEVTIDTNGRALTRFYHVEPLTDSMNRSELTRIVDKGRELIDRAGQRVGTGAHNMAQKNYPLTTHAGTIEYRLLDLRNLDALYHSIRRSWETGKGRKLTIKEG